MEESEKRRERLRAMREEANEANDSSSFVAQALPGSLLNPLLETPSQEQPCSNSTRFDFYTDPMSAFSANKRRNDVNPRTPSEFFRPPAYSGPPVTRFQSPLPGPRNTEITPRAYQYQGNYSPNQQMYQPRSRGHNPIHHRSPMGGMSRPYNTPQGNQNYPIGPGVNYSLNPPLQPGFIVGQETGYWVNNRPSLGSGRGGSSGSSWGRGGGRYHGRSASPGPGWRGGRGPGSGGRSMGPERFYDESMIEDPWKVLEPVIWTEIRAPDLSKFWTPSSDGTKKARVLDASNKTDSQPSLAEYLAASFNEAVEDAPTS